MCPEIIVGHATTAYDKETQALQQYSRIELPASRDGLKEARSAAVVEPRAGIRDAASDHSRAASVTRIREGVLRQAVHARRRDHATKSARIDGRTTEEGWI